LRGDIRSHRAVAGSGRAAEAIEYLSAEAYRAYHSLVYETDGFDRFFRESTVIGEIANL
jgi:phosphoenolpyruvate carboxylase